MTGELNPGPSGPPDPVLPVTSLASSALCVCRSCTRSRERSEDGPEGNQRHGVVQTTERTVSVLILPR